MELTINVNGKKKSFKSKKITFKMMRRSIEIINGYGTSFFGEDYPPEQLDEALEFICDYFGIQKEEFENGYMADNLQEFYNFFVLVLNDVQSNSGKRVVATDEEGK